MRQTTGRWYSGTRRAAVERINRLDRHARRLQRCTELSALAGLSAVGAAVAHLLRWPWASVLLLMAGAVTWLLLRTIDDVNRRQLQLSGADDSQLDQLLNDGRPVRRAGRVKTFGLSWMPAVVPSPRTMHEPMLPTLDSAPPAGGR